MTRAGPAAAGRGTASLQLTSVGAASPCACCNRRKARPWAPQPPRTTSPAPAVPTAWSEMLILPAARVTE